MIKFKAIQGFALNIQALSVIAAETDFHPRPEVLDVVQVGRLWRPVHNVKILLAEPVTNEFPGVLAVVVLLEYCRRAVHVVILESLLELVLQYFEVAFLVHAPFYPTH